MASNLNTNDNVPVSNPNNSAPNPNTNDSVPNSNANGISGNKDKNTRARKNRNSNVTTSQSTNSVINSLSSTSSNTSSSVHFVTDGVWPPLVRSATSILSKSDPISSSRIMRAVAYFQGRDEEDNSSDSAGPSSSISTGSSVPSLFDNWKWPYPESKYPLIFASPAGTILVLLKMDVGIEISIDRAVRLYCNERFAMVWDAQGTNTAIVHPSAYMYQNADGVFGTFHSFPTGQSQAGRITPDGVLFKTSNMSFTYLLSSITGSPVIQNAGEDISCTMPNYDITTVMFYRGSQNGQAHEQLCNKIIQKARRWIMGDGALRLSINGILIKQAEDGRVDVYFRRRSMKCSPMNLIVSIDFKTVQMGVESFDFSIYRIFCNLLPFTVVYHIAIVIVCVEQN